MASSVGYWPILIVICTFDGIISCNFPEQLQGQTWTTDIKPSQQTNTLVYFWGEIMESQKQNTTSADVSYVSQNYCLQILTTGKYIVSSERNPQSSTVTFKCLQFIFRSKSILQIKSSDESSVFTNKLCNDNELHLHPWLLVSYSKLDMDVASCPLIGGYDMKIMHQDGTGHICNSNDIPMRLESNCFVGESILFDLQDRSCVSDLPMSVSQKATCVATWQTESSVVTVVRKLYSNQLWCLVYNNDTYNSHLNAWFYTDLYCGVESTFHVSARHYKLLLYSVIQDNLCRDQHKNCARLPCIGPYTNMCLKSCGKCDPNLFPTHCDFPFYIRGHWFLNNKGGQHNISVSVSRVTIEQQWDFNCVCLPGSPKQATNTFTTVSLLDNGCRPRYTCLKFRKYGANIIGLAMSQSMSWPLEMDTVATQTCDPDNFYSDPPPINDTYRNSDGSFKPAVTLLNIKTGVPCKLDSVYKIEYYNGTQDKTCTGTMYQTCSNKAHLSIESTCFENAIKKFTCIGQIPGKYWEKMIILQPVGDTRNTLCLIFSSLKSDKAMLTVSAECDHSTWMLVDVGLRKPLLKLHITSLPADCKHSNNSSAHSAKLSNDLSSTGQKGFKIGGQRTTQSHNLKSVPENGDTHREIRVNYRVINKSCGHTNSIHSFTFILHLCLTFIVLK